MICRTTALVVFALSFISFGMSNAIAADAQIYKCAQPNGRVLYTDQACKSGMVVDIRLDPSIPTRSRAWRALGPSSIRQKRSAGPKKRDVTS